MTEIRIRQLGETDFEDVCQQMQQFTLNRRPETPDELWVTSHQPVYSLGLNRKQVNPPLREDIPLVHCDRGGKITYHGPGQLIVYGLIDLSRYGFNIRDWVSVLEQSVVSLLMAYGLSASTDKHAPGVYVDGAKIASLGLRMKKHYCYHGLSVNVDMDLSPFQAIDPCGYAGLPVTQCKDLGIDLNMTQVAEVLLSAIQSQCVPVKACMVK